MKFQNSYQIFFVILIVCQLSIGYLIKRSTTDNRIICYHSNSCGWQIDKKNGEIEYVENHCQCKPDEQCLRTAKEYRLPGWKFHCKRIQEIKEGEEIVLFPSHKDKKNSTQNATSDE